MKILLTGADGTLGTEVVAVMEAAGHEIARTDVAPRTPGCVALDVSDGAAVERAVVGLRPDYVFHLAAMTDVDQCEREPEACDRANRIGTENIVRACSARGAPLLYVSTGGIFGGEKREPYIETDAPAPVNAYARSKYAGERAVTESLERYFIMRASWMVGDRRLDKKFVSMMMGFIEEGRTRLVAVDDKFGTPCFARDFARQIPLLLETGAYGIYHCANNGCVTRYDIAKAIVEIKGLTGRVTVEPVGSDRFPAPAPRPRSEAIANHNLDRLGINAMPPWRESLERYIEAY
jgi:dTDP-4-dehydrorhamnose reductase